MLIKFTEKELKKLIKEAVSSILNQPFLTNSWDLTNEYMITEGLTCTYNIGKVINILKHKFQKEIQLNKIGIGGFDFNRNSVDDMFLTLKGNSKNNDFKTTQDTDNWMNLFVSFNKGIKNIIYLPNEIMKVCEACGWFFTHFLYYKNGEPIVTKTLDYENEWLLNQQIQMHFRAKFNVEYKDKSVPSLLYHITPSRVVPKILKQGLTPRANGRQEMHPERVYCYTEYPNDWKEIANNFRSSGKKEDLYTLLEIDKRKINPKIKFYYDSNTYTKYPTAIYTNEPIPPTAIKIIAQE